MAGENVRILCDRRDVISINCKLEADAAKGDVIFAGNHADSAEQAGQTVGFTMMAGKTGDIVPVCVKAHLVIIKKGRAMTKDLAAGTLMSYSRRNAVLNLSPSLATAPTFLAVERTNFNRNDQQEMCGILHADFTAADDDDFFLVWEAL